MPGQTARDTFLDVASILGIVLVGLVVFALSHPGFRTEVGRVFQHQGTQSSQVTNGTLAGARSASSVPQAVPSRSHR